MAFYSTNEFKGGLKIMLDGDPYSHRRERVRQARQGPGLQPRSHPQPQDRARRSRSTFKSGDTVEARRRASIPTCSISTTTASYWHFMDPESFEQLTASTARRRRGGQVDQGEATSAR
ncbi:MAG: hypothetical protein MZV65_42355 [Chromatiales bacterium]|nr:hypothetical protein [Chromatiales bacterium]